MTIEWSEKPTGHILHPLKTLKIMRKRIKPVQAVQFPAVDPSILFYFVVDFPPYVTHTVFFHEC